LVSAIASNIIKNSKLNTFCCGMKDGTDLQYGKIAANYIKSYHSEYIFTDITAFNSIEDVIYTIESWDTTTIRASVGQYLISEYVKKMTDIKVLLVGEGSDEICSSYIFNYNAPNERELHECAIEYVKKIHLYDGKRADRCISKFGLEARMPFLDIEFIKAYWTIPAYMRHPKYKNIEKWWLRKAFEPTNLLPQSVLWRGKEAFSDGISKKEKSWYNIINDNIIKYKKEYIKDFDKTKDYTIETYYYKKIFISYFGENRLNIIPHYWQPKWCNDNIHDKYIDPSARILNIYNT
jgi:asparagine synthase (glutamine-hydrolysing)